MRLHYKREITEGRTYAAFSMSRGGRKRLGVELLFVHTGGLYFAWVCVEDSVRTLHEWRLSDRWGRWLQGHIEKPQVRMRSWGSYLLRWRYLPIASIMLWQAVSIGKAFAPWSGGCASPAGASHPGRP
jgi:hypothetical protein